MIIWADYVSQGHDDEMHTLILQVRHVLSPMIMVVIGFLIFN